MEVKMTLILFNTESTLVYNHVAVKDVPNLTTDIYRPDNGTALRDALGDAMTNMRQHVSSLSEDNKPGFVSFFI